MWFGGLITPFITPYVNYLRVCIRECDALLTSWRNSMRGSSYSALSSLEQFDLQGIHGEALVWAFLGITAVSQQLIHREKSLK